jgi:hypothetical protein
LADAKTDALKEALAVCEHYYSFLKKLGNPGFQSDVEATARTARAIIAARAALKPNGTVGRYGLTFKQRQLLLFIDEYIGCHNVSPSFEEMKSALGLKSKSVTYNHVNALIERGYLEKLPNRARSIRIKQWPQELGG